MAVPPLPEQRRIVAKIEALTARSRRAKEALDAIPPLLERFRQSVLAAAFRGDLTADWRAEHPDVEPASELFERIRVERRRRWEEAELAKMRAKGKEPKDDKWKGKYKEPEPVDTTGLPELPEGWCWARWEEVGFCQNGRAFPSKHYSEKGVQLLRPGNLHVSGRLEWTVDNTRYMPEEWAENHPRHVVGPYQLVMNLTAQSLKDEFLGRVCLTGPDERCLLNQRIARITPVELAPRFCLWLFKSQPFRKYVDGLNTGSLIQHMFTSQVYDFVFPLPPALEQAALVTLLDEHDVRREALSIAVGDAAADHKTIDNSVLAKAFRGELVPQDPNDEPASKLLERIRKEREASASIKPARKSGRGRRARNTTVLEDAEATEEPEPAPSPEPPLRRPQPPQEPLQRTTRPTATLFLDLDPEDQLQLVHEALLGHGPLDVDAAVRQVADDLRTAGRAEFSRLRKGGPLYSAIEGTFRALVAEDRMDRPRRGHVRAVLRNARDYAADRWRTALLASMDSAPVDREDAIRAAAEWASENLGLEYQRLRTGGVIEEGLRKAIRAAVRSGGVERVGTARIQRRQ